MFACNFSAAAARSMYNGSSRALRSSTTSPTSTATIDKMILEDLRHRFLSHSDATAENSLKSWLSSTRLSSANSNKLSGAAVLLPLCYYNNKPSLLYTARSYTIRAHRGEISFPGGGAERQDTNAVDTALRETEEEIGLPRNGFQIWGTCTTIPNKALTHSVLPVVAAWQQGDNNTKGDLSRHKFAFNPSEVAEVFLVPLSHLCIPANHGYTRFKLKERLFTMPVFQFGDHKIWGLTAMFTHELLSILLPEFYKVSLQMPKLLYKVK